MHKYRIAQINIAHLNAPKGDELVAEFFENVPRINELAESSEGFIWRFDGDYPEPMVAFNMSVWESIELLSQFVYRSAHVGVLRRKEEWVKPIESAYSALWWIEKGHIPSVEEGLAKLTLLDELGDTSNSFTFANRFPPPE